MRTQTCVLEASLLGFRVEYIWYGIRNKRMLAVIYGKIQGLCYLFDVQTLFFLNRNVDFQNFIHGKEKEK